MYIDDAPHQSAEPLPEEAAYRVAATDQAYILRRGQWQPIGEKSLRIWFTSRADPELSAKERGAWVNNQLATMPLADDIGLVLTSPDPVATVDGRTLLNTFRGILKPSAEPGDWSTIAMHLRAMFTQPTKRIDQQTLLDWMLDWLAAQYQSILTGRGHYKTGVMPIQIGRAHV